MIFPLKNSSPPSESLWGGVAGVQIKPENVECLMTADICLKTTALKHCWVKQAEQNSAEKKLIKN